MKLDYLENIKVTDSLYVNVYLNEFTVFAADSFDDMPEIELVDIGIEFTNNDQQVIGEMDTPDHRSDLYKIISEAVAEHLVDHGYDEAFTDEARLASLKEQQAFIAETRRW